MSQAFKRAAQVSCLRQELPSFIQMASAEWWKLVGEVQHALSSHRRHRDAAERELFDGRLPLASKNDDDLPVLQPNLFREDASSVV